jgi:hypothetical protein
MDFRRNRAQPVADAALSSSASGRIRNIAKPAKASLL